MLQVNSFCDMPQLGWQLHIRKLRSIKKNFKIKVFGMKNSVAWHELAFKVKSEIRS